LKPIFFLFGSGNFALGSVIALEHIADSVDIVLITRRPTSEQSRQRLAAIRSRGGYFVRLDGQTREFFVKISRVLLYDDHSDFSQLVDLVKSQTPIIIGTSVGKGNQPVIADQLRRLINNIGNPDGSSIVVFRFENEIHECWDDSFVLTGVRRIYFPDLVVDRICRNMDVVPFEDSTPPALLVSPESYRRIDVKMPDLDGEPIAWVRKVDAFVELMGMTPCDEIEPYSLLKAWNINGAQAVLCAYASAANYNSLKQYFDEVPQAETILRNICREFLAASVALLTPTIPRDEIITFAQSSYDRLRSADDYVDGILHQWEADITAHRRKLDRRIVPVLKYLTDRGHTVLSAGYNLLKDQPPRFRTDLSD
jgi:hypothetical protein